MLKTKKCGYCPKQITVQGNVKYCPDCQKLTRIPVKWRNSDYFRIVAKQQGLDAAVKLFKRREDALLDFPAEDVELSESLGF